MAKRRGNVTTADVKDVATPFRSKVNPPPRIPTGVGDNGEFHHLSFAIRAGRLHGDSFSKKRLALIPVDHDCGPPIEGAGFNSILDRKRQTHRSIPSDGPSIVPDKTAQRVKSRKKNVA